MSVGNKRNRITIQKATLTADTHGGSTVVWSTRCTVWAHERPQTGREALQAGSLTSTRSTVFEIWHRTDVTTRDQIVFGTRTLRIESIVDPHDTRAELYLTCSEVV
jgi:SPP1 family predicted phage head-tail adaptor